MKSLVIINVIMFLLIQSAYGQNVITYTERKGSYSLQDSSLDTLVIKYDFEFSSYHQKHWTIDYIFQSRNFPRFLNIAFGNQMHYQHKRNLIDIVDDLYKFSKDFDLDSFELLSIVIAMSNSLSKVHHPDYVISDFYYPYEIIFTGVHKEIDRQSFFAGVMSMLCYDVSVIFRDNQMIMGVLVENKQDYYYQEKKYQALLPHFDPEVEKVFTFDEICHFDKVYQDPVSSNIRHQLREAQYIGDVQYKFSNVQSDGRSYKSNVSITNEFVSESKRLKDNKVRIDQNSQIKGYVIKDDGQRLEVVSEIR